MKRRVSHEKDLAPQLYDRIGKAMGAMTVAAAFAGCASPEQAENCFKPSGMPVKEDARLTAIDAIVENYMGQDRKSVV